MMRDISSLSLSFYDNLKIYLPNKPASRKYIRSWESSFVDSQREIWCCEISGEFRRILPPQTKVFLSHYIMSDLCPNNCCQITLGAVFFLHFILGLASVCQINPLCLDLSLQQDVLRWLNS